MISESYPLTNKTIFTGGSLRTSSTLWNQKMSFSTSWNHIMSDQEQVLSISVDFERNLITASETGDVLMTVMCR